MLPSGKCPRRIAPAAAMVDEFKWNQKYTNKTQLLPSFLTVDRRKKAHHRPSTHILGTTAPDPNPNATIQVEDGSCILSYQT